MREESAAVQHGRRAHARGCGRSAPSKTRAITERIRRLLEDDPDLAGESILALTFTDKAAGEMKHRVVKASGRARGKGLTAEHLLTLLLLGERFSGRQRIRRFRRWMTSTTEFCCAATSRS